MKKIYYVLLAFVLLSSKIWAQTVEDSVVLGLQYANQSFYSLADGEQANVSNTNWDLSFGFNGYSAAVRINDGNGVALFAPLNQDPANFATLDTTGMIQMLNDYTDWETGAFNVQSSGTFDYGWGEYNSVNHKLEATRTFVLKLSDGSFRKIMIDSLVGGNHYYFTLATLDNSLSFSDDILKDDNKFFLYYDVEAQSTLNLEPDKGTWDIVFRRYAIVYPGVGLYPVVGALTAYNVLSAQLNGVDVEAASGSGLTYEEIPDLIGFDWKTYDMGSSSWILDDSVVYFVETEAGEIYKLYFTAYSGSGTGIIKFKKEMLATTGINDAKNANFAELYPNPTKDVARLNIISHTDENSILKITDLNGKIVYQSSLSLHQGLNQTTLQTEQMASGQYVVTVIGNTTYAQLKFVKL